MVKLAVRLLILASLCGVYAYAHKAPKPNYRCVCPINAPPSCCKICVCGIP